MSATPVMAVAASDKSSDPGTQRRSKRSRHEQSKNTFPDNKPAFKRFKFTCQRPSESSVRTLYQLAESVIARIEVLEGLDEEHVHAKNLHSRRSDDTTSVSDEDANRRLYKMLEAALARVSVLEERRDICYRNAFKAADGTECIVRGCGAKSSSPKNDIRHIKNTITPEHKVAAIILQQTNCLQCAKPWKTPSGLDHHEKTVHKETRSSRMDTFQPFLQQSLECIPGGQSTQSWSQGSDSLQSNASDVIQPNWSSFNDLRPLADCTPADPPLQLWQPGPESLQPNASDVLQPNWSSSNDLEPWEDPVSTYPSMQPSQPRLNNLSPITCTPIQPDWSRSEYHQQSLSPATGDHSTQPPQSEFTWAQPIWSSSNDLFNAG